MAELLRSGQLRARVSPGDPFARMDDGGQIELIWRPVKASRGHGPGWRLLLRCPACRRGNCRQLERRPLLTWWRCCNCRHRTPEGDARARQRKLRRARRARLAARRAHEAAQG